MLSSCSLSVDLVLATGILVAVGLGPVLVPVDALAVTIHPALLLVPRTLIEVRAKGLVVAAHSSWSSKLLLSLILLSVAPLGVRSCPTRLDCRYWRVRHLSCSLVLTYLLLRAQASLLLVIWSLEQGVI